MTKNRDVRPQVTPVPQQFKRFIEAHGKSPWNPSITAIKRVPSPLPVPTVHHCGHPIEIAHHTQVYAQEYSDWPWLYRCEHCDAHVGMHPFTNIPLGTLADKKLREFRKSCKPSFDALWREGTLTRKEAYALLADHLQIELNDCHFALFNEAQCQAAMAWADQFEGDLEMTGS